MKLSRIAALFIFLCLGFTSPVWAEGEPLCPVPAAVSQVDLNEVELTEEGYAVYRDGYVSMGTKYPWLLVLGGIHAADFEQALATGKGLLAGIDSVFDEVASEDTDHGMWICMYPTPDPMIYALAITPVFDSHVAVKDMMTLQKPLIKQFKNKTKE